MVSDSTHTIPARSIWREERAQGEFNSLYTILVLIIAALLLITVVKPMFRQSQKLAQKTPVVTSGAAP
ncbi:MAG: hypothetical protein IPJ89_02570 [Candidatus Iainarchaeum archaeon]|uniref:Uncharacterized protein n=1 Tax=Candidatus Iainarchaeum sp. TaxID=3101447 RepID=A0A7T9I274_9ARCH|nr:MAG: hypothetical protein IPJ89_02570 [Candidatus Diapherotrites archaeon]